MATNSWKSNLKYSLKLALAFQIGWFVAAIVALLINAPVDMALLALLIPVLWVPAALELITATKFPFALQMHYYVFITLSSVAGSAFEFYALVPNWDTWVHIDSGVLLAWLGLFGVLVLQQGTKIRIPRWFVISAALATPLAFASLWEISEFLSDMFLHTTTQAGLEDTIVDMIAALVGAVIAVALLIWFKVPKSVLPR